MILNWSGLERLREMRDGVEWVSRRLDRVWQGFGETERSHGTR
jgi:hypothetical protein